MYNSKYQIENSKLKLENIGLTKKDFKNFLISDNWY